MITADTVPRAFEVKSIHKEIKFHCKNRAIITRGITRYVRTVFSLEESFFFSFFISAHRR